MKETKVKDLDLFSASTDARTTELRKGALGYLQGIYGDPLQPTSVRMRAAAIAIPFEQPKLQATAITHYDGDFADRLDRALARSAEPKVVNEPSKVIEHKPAEPQVTPAQMSAPFTTLRRRA
jgi:hypothetical protein